MKMFKKTCKKKKILYNYNIGKNKNRKRDVNGK